MTTASGLASAPSPSYSRTAVRGCSHAPNHPLSVPLVVAPRGNRGRRICFPGARSRQRAISCCSGAVSVGGGEPGGGGGRHQLVRTLLIDNYDSYTYNIYQELSVVNGVPPVVVQNDELTWDRIRQLLYEESAFDNIVISPGPGSPAYPADVGVCLQLLLECADIPILGVCLGHQALAYVHGALVVHAPEPVHGRLSEIEHSGCDLFDGIPSGRKSGFKVVRYHSLVVDPVSLPRDIIPVAWARDTLSFLDNPDLHATASLSRNQRNQLMFSCNAVKPDILMGIKHSTRPHYGVQFHPESVATCYGRKLFENFKEITVRHGLRSVPGLKQKVQNSGKAQLLPVPHLKQTHENSVDRNLTVKELSLNGYDAFSQRKSPLKHFKLQWKKLDGLAGQIGGAENIFIELYGDKNGEDTFWLDSSSTDKGRARFSFMGGKGGSLWKQVTFWLSEKSDSDDKRGGHLTIQDAKGSKRHTYLKDGFLDFLDKELLSFCYNEKDYEGLPFNFHGGFVGFIGYNIKIECGASTNRHQSRMPDACFFFSDNLLVVDHEYNDVYILSIHEIARSENPHMTLHKDLDSSSWLDTTESTLINLKVKVSRKLDKKIMAMGMPNTFMPNFTVDKPKCQYVNDVDKCLHLIREGESYELCLTTQMRMKAAGLDALGLYLDLRNQNPAPYAAWLNFSKDNLSICCSSPERFLRLDGNGVLEAKPIKGTIRRGSTFEEDESLRLQLLQSEKDQAENLMIVDLLRNDLGRVCQSGTVHVPHLMDIESYATVHTLVSTIQGTKKSNLSAIDCVRAAFPGGSMTGAPKMRSMELLDSLECCSRGVYSGSIGFFSYNKTFDLNIVIRTIVLHQDEISIGAGGAVVTMSNPEDEYEEMLLKAKAPKKAIEGYFKKTHFSDGRVTIATK